MSHHSDRSATRRRRLRESVVRVLYAIDVGGADVDAALAGYRDYLAEGPVQEDLDQWVKDVMARREEVDELIRRASTNWRLERIGSLERCLLRLGGWELLARPEIPARATINEAVEIAHRYGGEDSPAFVNGILDRVARLLADRSGEVRGE
jgi:transcription antitermination protein NusB